jgi:hypothetical protein
LTQIKEDFPEENGGEDAALTWKPPIQREEKLP